MLALLMMPALAGVDPTLDPTPSDTRQQVAVYRRQLRDLRTSTPIDGSDQVAVVRARLDVARARIDYDDVLARLEALSRDGASPARLDRLRRNLRKARQRLDDARSSLLGTYDQPNDPYAEVDWAGLNVDAPEIVAQRIGHEDHEETP